MARTILRRFENSNRESDYSIHYVCAGAALTRPSELEETSLTFRNAQPMRFVCKQMRVAKQMRLAWC
jgi:hypothetical protein